MIKLHLPLPIHASTQCDNREPENIEFFNKLGLSRVVLAREFSLEQIKQVHKQNPKLELEAFVHGALCVSYSGQCYLSQYIGGRSANRGECAQPCRKKYTLLDDKNNVIKKDSYLLCLKDFNASKHIKEMIASGVFSFKIEGRLKDIGYVKNVVSYYRNELDKYSEKISSGKTIYPYEPDVEKTFNRGYTNYFLKDRTDCFNNISPKSRGKYIGVAKRLRDGIIYIETEFVLHPQDGLCYIKDGELEGFLVNKAEKFQKGFIVYSNKPVKINSNCKIYRNTDVIFEKELLKPVKRQIGVCVVVEKNKILLTDENNISISIPFTSKEQAKNQDKMSDNFVKQFSKTGETDFYIQNIALKGNIPFMRISELNNLRRIAFAELMEKRLNSYKREEQNTLKYVPFYKNEVDYKANIHNKKAEEFYEKCGVKVCEYSMESKLPSRQIELMRTKHCIKHALNMCKTPKNLFLQDEKGIKYPLKFDCKNCEMVVLSPDKAS